MENTTMLMRCLDSDEEQILMHNCSRYCIRHFNEIIYESDYCRGYRIGFRDESDNFVKRYEEIIKLFTTTGLRYPDKTVFYDGYNAGRSRAKIKRIQQEHRDILNSIDNTQFVLTDTPQRRAISPVVYFDIAFTSFTRIILYNAA